MRDLGSPGKHSMPLVVSIEDVGWWSGTDGSAFNQPFRTAMPRDHVPEDYTALAALGKGLGTRVLAGFVLYEWDKSNLLQRLMSATWMGDKWCTSLRNQEQKEKAASIRLIRVRLPGSSTSPAERGQDFQYLF